MQYDYVVGINQFLSYSDQFSDIGDGEDPANITKYFDLIESGTMAEDSEIQEWHAISMGNPSQLRPSTTKVFGNMTCVSQENCRLLSYALRDGGKLKYFNVMGGFFKNFLNEQSYFHIGCKIDSLAIAVNAGYPIKYNATWKGRYTVDGVPSDISLKNMDGISDSRARMWYNTTISSTDDSINRLDIFSIDVNVNNNVEWVYNLDWIGGVDTIRGATYLKDGPLSIRCNIKANVNEDVDATALALDYIGNIVVDVAYDDGFGGFSIILYDLRRAKQERPYNSSDLIVHGLDYYARDWDVLSWD